MQKPFVAIAVASLICPFSIVQAADANSPETLVVTANRFEQNIDSSIAAITVVTRDEIDAIQAQDLIDVLRRLPGIQTASNGGYGSTKSVFVRGTNSDQVLVLIDGVRFGSATLGSANLSAVPLVSIERIEYLRGSRAAMYGADAIGGIINIITDNKRDGGNVATSAGSNNYRSIQGMSSGYLLDDLHASIGVSASKTDGFSAKSGTAFEDNDGFKSRSLTLTSHYQASPQLAVGALAVFQKGEAEYDGFSSGDGEKSENMYNFVSHVDYQSNAYATKLIVGFNQDYSHDYSLATTYQTDRTQFSWSNQYQIINNLVIGGGIDWNDDVISSTQVYDETSRSNLAAYLNAQLNGENYTFEAAVRNDDNERYGSNSTWQLGAGYQLTEQYRVVANIGTAYRAPTFNDLYFPGYGVDTIQAEESDNYEVAIEADYSLADVRISAYHNDIKNMIDYDRATFLAVNYGKVEINGVEFVANFDTGELSHQVSYDYTDAKNVEEDSQLVRRAKHSAKWNTSYQLDHWQFDLSYLYQGKRYDSSTTLEAYSLVDLTGSYAFDNNIKLSAKIGNLFDKEYETISGYNSAERNVTATVSYDF